jgi:hypothetical protein
MTGTFAFSTIKAIRAFISNYSAEQAIAVRKLALQMPIGKFMICEGKGLKSEDLCDMERLRSLGHHVEIWNHYGTCWNWEDGMNWMTGIGRYTHGILRRVERCDRSGERDGRYVCLKKRKAMEPEREHWGYGLGFAVNLGLGSEHRILPGV